MTISSHKHTPQTGRLWWAVCVCVCYAWQQSRGNQGSTSNSQLDLAHQEHTGGVLLRPGLYSLITEINEIAAWHRYEGGWICQRPRTEWDDCGPGCPLRREGWKEREKNVERRGRGRGRENKWWREEKNGSLNFFWHRALQPLIHRHKDGWKDCCYYNRLAFDGTKIFFGISNFTFPQVFLDFSVFIGPPIIGLIGIL